MQRITISKEFRFEASHVLPKHPGKCSRLHGHSWVLTVGVSGVVNPDTGFVVDYGDLSALVKEHVVDKLDHTHLGQGGVRCDVYMHSTYWMPYFGESFYPSSENLVVAIAKILQPLILELPGVRTPDGPQQILRLEWVRLNETCTSQAEWRQQ